jgi:glucose-6-phosphate isomerase, archaeal
MKPFSVQLDLAAGTMANPDRIVVRRASSMRGHYRDAAALERLIAAGDPVHYEVLERAVPGGQGHLMSCISRTHPGTVGGEYFMTKGHYHEAAGTAEIYVCLAGQGYMLMRLPSGEAAWERFEPGRLVYVPPYWGHRTVNTGREVLASLCVYPAEAGHDYGEIEKEGFPVRIIEDAGGPRFVKDGE